MTTRIAISNLGGKSARIKICDGDGSWHQPDLIQGQVMEVYLWDGKSITVMEAGDDDSGTDNQPR